LIITTILNLLIVELPCLFSIFLFGIVIPSPSYYSVEVNWLKGKSFWHTFILKVCSLSWKKLLNLRNVVRKFISFKVGDGSRISLWFDNWHHFGRLIDNYGFLIVYDSGSCLEARVLYVI